MQAGTCSQSSGKLYRPRVMGGCLQDGGAYKLLRERTERKIRRKKNERWKERKKEKKRRKKEGWLKVDEGQGNFSILAGYPTLFRGRKRRRISWEEYLRVFKG